MPHLQFQQGEMALFRYLLRAGRTVIGRSDTCDVALPSEGVSRVHCVVEQREGQWWVVDRSRNGTRVNGGTVQRHPLAHDDLLQLGDYVARFVSGSGASEGNTATVQLSAAAHEELLEASEAGVATTRAELEIIRGPHAGRKLPLKHPRASVGGRGADLCVDDALPRQAVRLRVVRGRVMAEPGETPSYLDGRRIREITPVHEGEEVRLGEHGFTVRTLTLARADQREGLGDLVGSAPVMRQLFGVLSRMARHDAPVLLTGESGVGKELAARALHDCGPRHAGPFTALNCAAIAPTLFESELFGHEKGAFTGATARQDGAFQRSDGGTLFLDEVGELPLEDQAKLLRALESGEVRRVGGAAAEFPDVRIVAATNRDLHAMVRDGSFRSDLYYRLEVLTLRIPPLRERPEDVPLLALALLERQHPGAIITEDALRALGGYAWPGNVRELRNVLTRAFVLGGPHITPESLSFQPWAFDGPAPRPMGAAHDDGEGEAILAAIRRQGGNKTRAAQALGMPRSSLLYKMKRLGISDT